MYVLNKIIFSFSEWTEMFPYDFRDERMMKQLKEISHRVLKVYPDLRQDIGAITHNLINKVRYLTNVISNCIKSKQLFTNFHRDLLISQFMYLCFITAICILEWFLPYH